MARINIDDELYSDVRFRTLIRKLGDEDKAIGMLVRFWFAAQQYWADGQKLIPHKLFEADGLGPLLEVDLAEIRDGGVYAKGATERFEWYRAKCEQARSAIKQRWARIKADTNRNTSVYDTNTERIRWVNPPVPVPDPVIDLIPQEADTAVTTKPSEPSAPRFDFESIYVHYPRKAGKKQGIEKAKRQVKTREQFDNLKRAIQRYAAYCVEKKLAPEYIRYFSSFMTAWEDWLEEGAGGVATQASRLNLDDLLAN